MLAVAATGQAPQVSLGPSLASAPVALGRITAAATLSLPGEGGAGALRLAVSSPLRMPGASSGASAATLSLTTSSSAQPVPVDSSAAAPSSAQPAATEPSSDGSYSPEASSVGAQPSAEPSSGTAGETGGLGPPPAPAPPGAAGGSPSATGAQSAQGSPSATGAAGPEESANKLKIQAGSLFVSGDMLAASGGVSVSTAGYTIKADTAEINRRTNIARFRGHVVIEGHEQRTTGDTLWLDLNSGWWKLEPGSTTVQPDFFTKGVLAPLYGKGKEVEYQPNTDTIDVLDGQATSCNLEHPHYDLQSDQVKFRPGDKVTFQRPTLYLYGHRLIRYPFNLTLSLKQQQQNILPQIGSDAVEGDYVKFAFLYLLGAAGSGVLRLNLTQKRGLGLGFDHLYQTPRQSLSLSVFDEPTQGALSARAQQTYHVTKTLSSDFSVNYQTNSGYLYSSSSLSSNLTFRNSDINSDMTLGFSRSLTTSSYGSSGTFGSNLYYNQRLGQNTTWNLRTTYTSSQFSSSDTSPAQLNGQFELRHQAPSYDTDFTVSNQYDLGTNAQGSLGSYALNSLPAISFRTDSRRLGGWRLFGRAASRLQFDLGSFVQDPGSERVRRASFTDDMGGTEQRLSKTTTNRSALRFRQSWYDDGSAQYNLSFNDELRHDLTSKWMSRLTYDYATTRGFSPLRLDYGGLANDARWELVRLVRNRSRLDLSGGYDFLNNAYYDVQGLYELRPSVHSYWRLQAAYSIEQSTWWPLVLRYTTASKGLYMDMSASYDLQQHQLTVVTANTDFRVGPWWRIEFVGSYSGYSHAIDQANVRITRDLHCMLAQLVYSKYPRELYFTLGIKAFPSGTRLLGVGTSGAYVPSMPGQYY